MNDPRTDPPHAGDETAVLLGFLDYHRDTLRMKTDGLDAAQLAQTLPPSDMTLGGMLKHLGYVEDWWFAQVLRGADSLPPYDDVDWAADEDWDWHSAAEDTPEELRETWERCVARSRELTEETLAGDGLDATSVLTSHRKGDHFSLRWILVHMIEEYSRHNGHADLIRQSIDGQTGE